MINAPCAGLAIVIVAVLAILVAPTLRHLLFASPLWCTQVKAQIQEANIVGSFRTVKLKSGVARNGGPSVRDLKFLIVARYQYGGKDYVTRTYALYNEDVFLPGSPAEGSDGDYFRSAVERLRRVAPNTAYSFIQTDESRVDANQVKKAMAEIPAGIPHAEMDLRILKGMPGWNYFSLPFPDGVKWSQLVLLFWLVVVCGSWTSLMVAGMLWKGPSLKGFFAQTWPGWIIGAGFALLCCYWAYSSDRKPPPQKHIDEVVSSSQIHGS